MPAHHRYTTRGSVLIYNDQQLDRALKADAMSLERHWGTLRYALRQRSRLEVYRLSFARKYRLRDKKQAQSREGKQASHTNSGPTPSTQVPRANFNLPQA